MRAAYPSVRIVRARLDEPPPRAWLDSLSSDERARGDRFVDRGKGERFRRARAVLRGVLAEQLGVSPEDLAFDVGEHGKPSLRGAASPRFSLSHSGDLAVIAISDGADVGVDVEVVRPRENAERLARAVLSDRELARFHKTAKEDRLPSLLARFVLKEAIVKAWGTGIRGSLRHVDPGDVGPAFLTWRGRLGDHRGQGRQGEWAVKTIDAGEGAVGAVAALIRTPPCESIRAPDETPRS